MDRSHRIAFQPIYHGNESEKYKVPLGLPKVFLVRVQNAHMLRKHCQNKSSTIIVRTTSILDGLGLPLAYFIHIELELASRRGPA